MARGLAPRGHLLARRLLLSLRSIAMTRFVGKFVRNDKLQASSRTSCGRWDCRAVHSARLAMTRSVWQWDCRAVYSTRRAMTTCVQVARSREQEPFARSCEQEARGKCLFAIKRFVDDFCEAKITFP